VRLVVQRVAWAQVSVGGEVVGRCGTGFLVLAAAGRGDDAATARKAADRVWGLRVLADEAGKMNLSLRDVPGTSVLAVSNFTLYGDCSQRRPSFTAAAPYEEGEALFGEFVSELRRLGAAVETGVYGADMQVELQNDGPVTLVVDV
jgi:D-aminoacyl-tRNA deacylase